MVGLPNSNFSYSYQTYPRNILAGSNSMTVDKVPQVTDVFHAKQSGRTGKVNPSECETCRNRKYVDVSNDSNVSFKAPGHISPGASAAVVSSHEQEHVSNAKSSAAETGATVTTSVTLQMAVCPECGTSYVSGGTTTSTTTQVTYQSNNPYEQSRKSLEGSLLRGMNVDLVA